MARAYLPYLRDPGELKNWLLTARKAQWIAGLCLVAGLTLMPPARDAVLEAFLQPVTVRGGFLGLQKRQRENPGLPAARSAFNAIYWLGSAGVVAWLLWLHLPAAVGRRKQDGTEGKDDARPGAIETASTVLSAPGESEALDRSRATGVGSVVAERYAIEAELGRGAMGVVYCARDRVLDRTVALKELPAHLTDNPQLVERFRREARALARLSHPHIVQVHDLVESGRQLWMAMELVTGGSLEQELERQGRLPVDRSLELAQQMSEALAHAHEQGVIHRDFKPANVMLDRTGKAKVTDFGLAKLSLAPGLTQAGAVMGSPSYMSPEQATGGEADARADIYALGAATYEMLTGAPPFTGNDVTSVLMQHITTPPAPLREKGVELPAPFEALLLSMLEKKPEQRPASMQEIAERLRALRQA